jgi:hypothetical protein
MRTWPSRTVASFLMLSMNPSTTSNVEEVFSSDSASAELAPSPSRV